MSQVRRNLGVPDLSQVDELAVQFACNGTRMRLNQDERIVAVQRMIGQRPSQEIAMLVGTYPEEVGRIARATPGMVPCPYCHQRAYVDGEVFRRHVDNQGRRWCPQSGQTGAVRMKSIEAIARS